MSEPTMTRRAKRAVGLLAGVALFGGVLAAGATTSSAVVTPLPKTPVDLSTATTAVAPTVGRTDHLGASVTVTNNSDTAARAKIAISVTSLRALSVTPDAGLRCLDAAVPTTTGFTQACTTDLPLAGRASLSATLDLTPSLNPALRLDRGGIDLEPGAHHAGIKG